MQEYRNTGMQYAGDTSYIILTHHALMHSAGGLETGDRETEHRAASKRARNKRTSNMPTRQRTTLQRIASHHDILTSLPAYPFLLSLLSSLSLFHYLTLLDTTTITTEQQERKSARTQERDIREKRDYGLRVSLLLSYSPTLLRSYALLPGSF